MSETEELLKRIIALENVLRVTRSIVCAGAAEGFNPMCGEWASKLFMNNGSISKVLEK